MMTEHVDSTQIEQIVGMKRHRKVHFARAVSAEKTVYILHSRECVETNDDLTQCRFSRALDKGIPEDAWRHAQDVTVLAGVWDGRLIPVRVIQKTVRDGTTSKGPSEEEPDKPLDGQGELTLTADPGESFDVDEMGGWPVRRPTTIHEDSQED